MSGVGKAARPIGRTVGRRWRRWATGLTVFGGCVGLGGYFGGKFFLVSMLAPPPPVHIEQPNNEELIRSVRRPRVAIRIVQLFFWFLPLVLCLPIVWLLPGLRLWYIRWVKRTLEWVGPAFVKLGQWAVTREDLVPHDVCEVMSELHQHVTPHSARFSRRLVERELGVKFDELFSEFDPVPLGSGSIAQVHKARLRSTGEVVAIKICHPRVKERIALDFCCLKWIARVAAPFVPRTDLVGITDQFATSLSLQVDLRWEGKNLERFCENFAHLPQVVFPRPYPDLTAERVMVETFVDAIPIEHLTKASKGLKPEQIPLRNVKMVELGLDTYLQMLIKDNFFHADLHPGNILFSFGQDGVTPYLALVDAGITQTLSPQERENVFRFMQGVQSKDGLLCGQSIYNFSSKGQPYANKEKFLAEMQDLFKEMLPQNPHEPKWRKWGKRLGLVKYKMPRTGHVSAVVERMFDVTRENNVIMDSTYVSLLFSTLMMEGICNQIDPTVDLLKFSQNWFIASPFQRILGMSKHKSKSHY